MSKYFSLTPSGACFFSLVLVLILVASYIPGSKESPTVPTLSAEIVEEPVLLPGGRVQVKAKKLGSEDIVTLKFDATKKVKLGDIVDISSPVVGSEGPKETISLQ